MRRKQRSGISTSAGFGLQAFSKDELQSIHQATLFTLRHTGIKVLDKEALEIFHGAGACVERLDDTAAIVKMPGYMVEESIASSPAGMLCHGRNTEASFLAEPNRVGFTTFGGCINVIDPYTREVRRATAEDTGGFARMSDYLDEISVVERSVNATDAPAKALSVHNIRALLKNTGKHIFLGADSARSFQVMMQLAAASVGGMENLLKRPVFTPLACPESPLMLAGVVCQVIIEAARKGFGVAILPMGLSGGTSPATLAGAMVTHNAEVLSGLVLAQLARKGTPCVYASTSTILDLRIGTSAVGAPEYGMLNAALARLAQYYHLPCWVGGGASDSKLPDIQSGYEAMLSATLSALSGANFIFGCGVLEEGLTMDYAKLVMDAEMIRMIHKAIGGVTITDETLATDVIHEVGPAGAYIAHEHSYQHMKEQSQPQLFDRRSREDWMNATSGKPLLDQAYEKAIDILENHKPMPLPEGAAEEMDRIVREFEEETKQG